MKKLLIIIAIIFSYFCSSYACTTAIISGKYTIDGRPLLFKHRDTKNLQNKLMFFNDGKYEYTGLVNSADTLGAKIWAGCNSAGFAIMNSASYNLNLKDTSSVQDKEGFLMKQALQTCASLEDFEEMLRIMLKPLGANSNFGVIDSNGGAAYYETGNYNFVKYDANDPSIAPFGYIIRTNYSFSGEREKDYGLIRYQTAEELFNTASSMGQLSYKFLMKDVSRCLKHSLTKNNLYEIIPVNSKSTEFVDFCDFIPRYSSASSVIVQGIKKGEHPSLTTMWTILGFPLSSVAIPVWVAGGKNLPLITMADNTGNAPLCDMAIKLKGKIFPLTRGSYHNYINLAVLINQEKDGIMQKLEPLENSIINETEKKLILWREKGINLKEIQKFYQWLDKQVKETYKKQFDF